MSRSFKKFPSAKSDGPKSIRFSKRQANKRVRRTNSLDSGMSYKKVYCSWDIVDYKFVAYRDSDLDYLFRDNYYIPRFQEFADSDEKKVKEYYRLVSK